MERSYLFTMCLLIIHQIDAAYWQEWTMFNLPGGIQVYLLFNIIIIPIVLIGYKSVVIKDHRANMYCYLCVGLGLVTFIIHSVLFMLEYKQFDLPLSIVIIALCLFSSLYLLVQIHSKVNSSNKNLVL